MLVLCLAGGCQSADTVAANKSAQAQAALDQGRIGDARRAIAKAIAARDDVLDTWLLKAHIDLRGGDRQATFSDYEMALQLDHSNMEALQALCQLGLSAAPARCDRPLCRSVAGAQSRLGDRPDGQGQRRAGAP